MSRRSSRYFFLLTAFLFSTSVLADTRVALVIGNSRYLGAPPLRNPPSDAALVSRTLAEENFKVIDVRNATRSELLEALNHFTDEAKKADWALVYYAGHGAEIAGANYLLPVDARLKVDRDAQDEAISLERVLQTVDGARKLRLVILDACRDNPFVATMKRSFATRSLNSGLAPIEPQAGILVVYSAAAGHQAVDGAGDYSPFAEAFVNRMKEPGLEIRKLFDSVAADVMEATRKAQRPYVYGSNPSREDFFFKPPPPDRPTGASSDERTWEIIKSSSDVATIARFRDTLPAESPLRPRVEARLKELTPVKQAAAAQPACPPGEKMDAKGACMAPSPLPHAVAFGSLSLPKDPATGDKPYTMQCANGQCSVSFIRRSVSVNDGGMREVDIVDWRWPVDSDGAPAGALREKIRRDVVVACSNSELAVFDGANRVDISEGAKPPRSKIAAYDLWWAACRNKIAKFSKSN